MVSWNCTTLVFKYQIDLDAALFIFQKHFSLKITFFSSQGKTESAAAKKPEFVRQKKKRKKDLERAASLYDFFL